MLEIIELVGQGVDVAGVMVMVLGMVVATIYFSFLEGELLRSNM